MGRKRLDDKPASTAVRIGKTRPWLEGARSHAIRAYGPTPSCPTGRVVFPDLETGKKSSARPDRKANQTLDELFDSIERHLDLKVVVSMNVPPETATVDAPAGTRRDIRALGERYIAHLKACGRDDAYIKGRESILGKWVYPVVGDLLVQQWGPTESWKVIRRVWNESGSRWRARDTGSTLSGLRATAQRMERGVRWMDPNENPLEGVSYEVRPDVQGASPRYVDKKHRPSTKQVKAATHAAEEHGRWVWMPDIITIAAFEAPRQSEQLALRPWDVDFAQRELDINGRWKIASSGRSAGRTKVRTGTRVPLTKNGTRRTTPYLGSQEESLARLVARSLELDETTPVEVLRERIEAERERRSGKTKSGDWRDYQEEPEKETWLFPGEDGVPPTREQFNTAWHAVRDACGWPTYIPYRNLRHHAINWWKANIKEEQIRAGAEGEERVFVDVAWKTLVNRPGFRRGSQSTEDEGHGSTEEVPG